MGLDRGGATLYRHITYDVTHSRIVRKMPKRRSVCSASSMHELSFCLTVMRMASCVWLGCLIAKLSRHIGSRGGVVLESVW